MVRVRFIERLMALLLAAVLIVTLLPPTAGSAQEDTATPTETATIAPTETLLPTDTLSPTSLPPTPTSTAVPTRATSTIAATPTNTVAGTPTPTATPPSDSKIKVVTHICGQTVLDSGALNALDWAHQLIACPSLVL